MSAKEVFEEEYQRSIARQRIIHQCKERLRDGDVAEAVVDLVRVVEMLSASEERVMRLHAECFAMIEHAGRVLQLHERAKPIVVKLENPEAEPT